MTLKWLLALAEVIYEQFGSIDVGAVVIILISRPLEEFATRGVVAATAAAVAPTAVAVAVTRACTFDDV
jgi:hypothetical protein